MPGAPDQPARILAVCTANICRSPAVERLLRAGLDGSVRVGSAGVAALVGEPIDPPVAGFLRAQDVEVAGFAARQATESLLREADLVLTLTRAHRAQVLEWAPFAVRRAFTLLEFVRVVESVDLTGLPPGPAGARLRAILPIATAGRSLAPRPAPGGDDVADPFGRGPAAYEQSLAVIQRATETIIRIIGEQ